jgi:hypothetical protein
MPIMNNAHVPFAQLPLSIAYCSTFCHFQHSSITVAHPTLRLRSKQTWQEFGIPSSSRKRT